MLALQAVSRRYGGKHVLLRRGDPVSAVKDVTLTLCPGETLGIVGESGSGKSTLGRIAAGIEAPSEGRVTFDGEPYAAIDTAAWRRQRKTRPRPSIHGWQLPRRSTAPWPLIGSTRW